jgi:hypothetical protein
MTLEEYFPNLKSTGYAVTSPATSDYNCIAWAAGITDDWWWPDPLRTSGWPAAAPREETVAAFIEAFRSLGYAPCAEDTLEAGFEKVALYALAGMPKHAARQLADGRWTSKCGELEDIEHTLDGLVGTWYGSVVQVLKRPRPVPAGSRPGSAADGGSPTAGGEGSPSCST